MSVQPYSAAERTMNSLRARRARLLEERIRIDACLESVSETISNLESEMAIDERNRERQRKQEEAKHEPKS